MKTTHSVEAYFSGMRTGVDIFYRHLLVLLERDGHLEEACIEAAKSVVLDLCDQNYRAAMFVEEELVYRHKIL